MLTSFPGRAPAGPLSDLIVIELAGIGPSALACMILADLGAEVIRVERPGAHLDSFMPATADLLNRGKKSVLLDLKRPEGVEAVLALSETADVLVEGYRPGVTERLGLGPEAVRQRNPRLVYGRMTGWGQDGPLAQRAGHDIGYIAITGALHAIGDAGGPPQIPLSLVGDFGGGATYLVMGVLSALLDARRTGEGQVVDAAIIDGTNHLLVAVQALLSCGRWIDERGVNLFDGGSPFYSVYETADGKYMAVGPLEPEFYAEMLRHLDADADPGRQYDREQWPALRATLAEAFRRRTQAEWTAVFEPTDACVAPVLSVREARSHPQMASRGNVIEIDGVPQPAPAPRFSRYPAPMPTPPVVPGQHTDEILARIGREPTSAGDASVAEAAETAETA
jgi:alpha-methylacyl-CoA racemase